MYLPHLHLGFVGVSDGEGLGHRFLTGHSLYLSGGILGTPMSLARLRL